MNNSSSRNPHQQSTTSTLIRSNSKSPPPNLNHNHHLTSISRPPKLCTACEKPLSGQFVRALGGTYHLGCFKCLDCGQIVAAKFFPITDSTGKSHPLCERDYFSRLDLLCAKCGGALRGSYISALSRKYHVEHFTCSQCPTVFGANESYFEHDGAVFCHYHYSTQYAAICTGCKVAILKQFVEITRNNVEEQWHPECYMIHKSWNVTLAAHFDPALSALHSQPQILPNSNSAPSPELSASLRAEQQNMEDQANRVWSVLSVFEESAAACISDMLLHVSNGHYVDGVHEAALFILHVEVLFSGIDGVDARLAGFNDLEQVRLVVPKEPKFLCKKVVGFFSLLSQANSATVATQTMNGPATPSGTPRPRLGITQDLLALVTSLAHLLKVLIRQALVGALKLERLHGESGMVGEFLDTLMELSDQDHRLRAVLDTEVQSDLCHSCRLTIEEACVALGPIRWHVNCFACSSCNRNLVTDRYSAKYFDPGVVTESSRVICESCFSSIKDTSHALSLGRSGFSTVTSLSQYTFLLRVALKRLLGLLQVEEDGLTDALNDGRRKRVLSSSVLDATSAAVAAASSSSTQPGSQGSHSLQHTNAASSVTSQPPYPHSAVITPRSDSLPRNASSGFANAPSPATFAASVSAPKSPPDCSPSDVPLSLLSESMTIPRATVSSGPIASGPTITLEGTVDSISRPPAGPSQLHHQYSSPYAPAPLPPPISNISDTLASSYPQPQPPDQHSEPPPPKTVLPPQPLTPVAQPADMWLSEVDNLQIIMVRHLAIRELEQIMTLCGLMRSDEVMSLLDESKGSKSSRQRGGIWGKFVNSFVKGGNVKSGKKKSQLGVIPQGTLPPPTSSYPMYNFGSSNISTPATMGRYLNEASPTLPQTFNVPLSELMVRAGVSSSLGAGPGRIDIPAFVDTCIECLRTGDLYAEGIFRKNGNIRRLNDVKAALDVSPITALDMLKEDNSIQNSALLKKFLRELPEPLFTFRMYRFFTLTVEIPDAAVRRKALHFALCLLPKPNRNVLEVLLLCLRDVANASSHPTDPQRGSRMDYINLATVIAPNVLIPGRGMEEEHGAIVSVMFDLLVWQETLWTVPRPIAELIRRANTHSDGALDTSGAVTNPAAPHDLLKRAEYEARWSSTRAHRLSSASVTSTFSRPDIVAVANAHHIHAPYNALIEDDSINPSNGGGA